MKNKILITVILLLFSLCGIAQVPPPPPPPPPPADTLTDYVHDTVPIFTFAESMPDMPGGFMNYLRANIKYPKEEKKKGIEGTVYISFVVEKDGSISNAYVKRGVPGGEGLNAEALRVIREMPNWNPGKMNGVPVRIEITQPIKFVLDKGKKGN